MPSIRVLDGRGRTALCRWAQENQMTTLVTSDQFVAGIVAVLVVFIAAAITLAWLLIEWIRGG